MNSKRTARNQQIVDLVFASIIIAIILILTFTSWGYPKIGLIELTIVHIPVLVGTIMLGKKYGLLFGTVFGLGSFIMSFTNPTLYAPFTNPLVSVLPRIIFGYVIIFIYDWFKKIFKQKYIALPFTMGVATLVHSLLVLPFYYLVVKYELFIVKGEYIGGMNINIFVFIFGALIANAIFEIIASILVASAITVPLLILQEKYE